VQPGQLPLAAGEVGRGSGREGASGAAPAGGAPPLTLAPLNRRIANDWLMLARNTFLWLGLVFLSLQARSRLRCVTLEGCATCVLNPSPDGLHVQNGRIADCQ